MKFGAEVHQLFVLDSEQEMQRLLAFIRSYGPGLAAKGSPLVVEVTELEGTRTPEQNAAYWAGILRHVAEQATANGRKYPAVAWHEEFKGRFIGFEEGPWGTLRPMSTRKLSRTRFDRYARDVEEFAGRVLHVEFPPPDSGQ